MKLLAVPALPQRTNNPRKLWRLQTRKYVKMSLHSTATLISRSHRLYPNQYAIPLISILARGATPAGHVGSSNAECGTQCGSPGSESLVLNTSASSILMPEKYDQRCAGL